MSIFYIVILIGFIAVSVVSYITYNTIRQEHYKQNEYFVQLVNLSMKNMLDQYELSLDILGKRLLENKLYTRSDKATLLLSKILKENKFFAGFGLINTNGSFLFASNNVDISKMGNLKQNPETSYSFEQALKSKHLVVGRTYFVPGLGKWVIPLRKTLYNDQGKALAVIATGIELEQKDGFFNNIKLAEDEKILVVKSLKNDYYRIFYSGEEKGDKFLLYTKPIENEIVTSVIKSLYEQYDLTLNDLQQKNLNVTVEPAIKTFSDEDVFMSIVYNKKFDLWVSLSEPKITWKIMAYKMIAVYYILFFLLSYLLYVLFRYIHKSEERTKKELHYQATHDALTELPNRVYMQNNIHRWIRKFEGKCTVLFVDLDNFKNINDKFGHRIGDKLLQNVAKRFKNYFGEERLIVRQGGDEFIILVPIMQEHEKKEFITKMIEDISQPYEIDGLEFNISASVGTADYPNDTTDVEELFALADIAMYEAKKNKNTYASFSNTMREEIFDKIAMENELRNALQKDEFWMVYQPQISLDGSLHGVEALIRWKNEKLGMVSPELFIKAAEEIGIIHSIGDFIIQKALEEVRDIKRELNVNFSLSINIAVGQIMEKNFLDKVINFIECAQCKKDEISLEITETTFIEDVEYVLPILNEIRSHGIGLSLDDFGTGYSSLSMLKRLPIDELKIDKSFVDNILIDEKDKTLVKNIIKMGNELSMDTLAEGTEDYQQVELLKTFGCKLFQGYYFSKPLTKEELITFIKQENRE